MKNKLVEREIVIMKSPIKIKKHLVAKAPMELAPIKYNFSLFKTKELTLDDINNDKWLSERGNIFKKMLDDGHIGVIVLNDKNECVAYGWVAIGKVRPYHIPKIPTDSAWIHYNRVRDDYKGKGLQRLLIQEMVNKTREVYGNIEIYIDTSDDNIPSRINQLKLGFKECGIYYTIQIGTRRIPVLYFLWGWWDKDKKHPEI